MECFEKHDRLRVCDGPFASFLATCLECDGFTTRVLVEIFGREIEVTMPRVAFEKA
jgi:transcription antitermination factor NusG